MSGSLQFGALDIRGSGRSFVIMHQGAVVAGPYTSNNSAISALRGVERRLQPGLASFRKCPCGASFLATAAQPSCKACRKGVQ